MLAQPIVRPGIDWLVNVVAHESDSVTLDIGQVTDGDGFIGDVYPKERQTSDVLADSPLQFKLLKASFSPGAVTHTPVGKLIVEGLPVEGGFAEGLPKY